MSRQEKELRRLVRDFLSGREPFWEFHEGFIAHWTRLDRESLSEREREGWNEIYALILRAIPDPVGPEDAGRGIVGERELRDRIRGHPLAGPPS